MRGWASRAFRDPDRIARLFRPDSNLGLRLDSRHAALDIDPRNGGSESFAELTERYGHPPVTAMTLTGSGGFNAIYRVSRPVQTRLGLFPGIDFLGRGHLMVVPPSIHPVTGKRYVWINEPDHCARLPKEYLRLFTGDVEPASKRSGPLLLTRTDDPETLAADLITRFPVEQRGTRNVIMCRAIGSLLGRGYCREIVVDALARWHAHWLMQGVTRTSAADAEVETLACIHSTVGNERFIIRPGGANHREACREIELPPLPTTMTEAKDPEPEPARSLFPGMGVTARAENSKRLRFSRHERAFIEAWCVHVQHVIDLGELERDGVIRATHDQIREIAADRHPEIRWSQEQFERLKRKFISRPNDGKPATRHELLVEVVKGRRARAGESAGVPSEYRATGVLALLGDG